MSKETQEEITRTVIKSQQESLLAISLLVDVILKENNEETGERCPATLDALARGIQALADEHIL